MFTPYLFLFLLSLEFIHQIHVIRILDPHALSLARQFHLLCAIVDDNEVLHIHVGIDGGRTA